MELSLAASFGQRTDLPSSCRRVRATSSGITMLEVTPIPSATNCIRRKRSYTAPGTHTLCTYQKLKKCSRCHTLREQQSVSYCLRTRRSAPGLTPSRYKSSGGRRQDVISNLLKPRFQREHNLP
jgi:hypothetical protein